MLHTRAASPGESLPSPGARVADACRAGTACPHERHRGLRVDNLAAVFSEANGNLDEAVTTVLTASYQLTRE